jgi:hypothetical protein
VGVADGSSSPGEPTLAGLLPEESEPRILDGERPNRVVWSSLRPDRSNDEVHLHLGAADGGTSLRFALLTPDEAPDPGRAEHLRRRLSHLLFADLRLSYGQ